MTHLLEPLVYTLARRGCARCDAELWFELLVINLSFRLELAVSAEAAGGYRDDRISFNSPAPKPGGIGLRLRAKHNTVQ